MTAPLLITFGPEDFAPHALKGCSYPLYLTIDYKEFSIPQTLVDTGASLNVCPLATLLMLEIPDSTLKPTTLTVTAYDNSKRPALGAITLEIKFGPTTMPVEFHVINFEASFNLILGRRWIEQTKCVPPDFIHAIISSSSFLIKARSTVCSAMSRLKSTKVTTFLISRSSKKSRQQRSNLGSHLWSPLLTSTSRGDTRSLIDR